MSKRHGHAHDTAHLSDARLIWAIALNLLLSVVEAVVGFLSGSLSLLADAAHNFNDCVSLGVALIARIVSRKEADRRRTFGYRRAEVLGAFTNLLLLLAIGVYLVYEAVARYFSPQDVHGWPMIIAAGFALLVDIATVVFLYDMAKGSLNLRTGFLHNLADAFASVGVIAGGIVILLWGWLSVDLLITVTIAGYILWQSLSLLKPTVSILMEGVPQGLDLEQLASDIASLEGVIESHHIHVWELDENHRALEAHIVVEQADMNRMEAIKRSIKDRLEERYSIQHSTLEFETASRSCPSTSH